MLEEAGLPCDLCGSSDAKARYSNGDYCFSCSKWTKLGPDNVYHLKLKNKKSPIAPVVMPNSLPVQNGSLVDCFLKHRHFTDEMMFRYNLRQSACGNYLILSDTEMGKYKYIEVRNVNPNINAAKYITLGGKTDGYIVKDPKNFVIIVEDILSAMRVGWTYPCIALRGTKLSETMLSKFCTFKQPFTFIKWFDNDDAGKEGSIKFEQKLNWCGFNFVNILTDRDPKWYTTSKIKEIIEAHHEI